jgi:hypothetical protein
MSAENLGVIPSTPGRYKPSIAPVSEEERQILAKKEEAAIEVEIAKSWESIRSEAKQLEEAGDKKAAAKLVDDLNKEIHGPNYKASKKSGKLRHVTLRGKKRETLMGLHGAHPRFDRIVEAGKTLLDLDNWRNDDFPAILDYYIQYHLVMWGANATRRFYFTSRDCPKGWMIPSVSSISSLRAELGYVDLRRANTSTPPGNQMKLGEMKKIKEGAVADGTPDVIDSAAEKSKKAAEAFVNAFKPEPEPEPVDTKLLVTEAFEYCAAFLADILENKGVENALEIAVTLGNDAFDRYVEYRTKNGTLPWEVEEDGESGGDAQ